jgi:hypothetical protein
MLRQLLQDTLAIQQQGAGYYSCTPITRRYNKLLDQARSMLPEENSLISTFEALVEADPKDPSEKMKVIQGIRVEIGQLISLVETKPASEDRSGEST